MSVPETAIDRDALYPLAKALPANASLPRRVGLSLLYFGAAHRCRHSGPCRGGDHRHGPGGASHHTLRAAEIRFPPHDQAARGAAIISAPTRSAATRFRASSTAAAPR